MKFRKKPVVIEAIQWTGDNLKEVIEFTGRHKSSKDWSWAFFENVVNTDGLKIFTLEGSLRARVNDWIIKGIKGEFYPCELDIFEKTYEKVSEDSKQDAEDDEEKPEWAKDDLPDDCQC